MATKLPTVLLTDDEERYESPRILRPAAYVGLGTSGLGIMKLALAGGGAGFFLDGANTIRVPEHLQSRIFSVTMPDTMYRQYLELVKTRSDIFYPALLEELPHMKGGSRNGGATRRALGRLGIFDSTVHDQLYETAEDFIAASQVLRSGDKSEAVVNWAVSSPGGQGSGIILDVRKALNRALLSQMITMVHHVYFLLGAHAFSDYKKNKSARLKNHVATIAEMIAEMMTVDHAESHVFDTVLLMELPAVDNDEVRHENMRIAMQFSNPSVWKDVYNLMVNSETNYTPEAEWLRHFARFSAGAIGTRVQVGEVLSAVASAINERNKVTAPGNLTLTLTPHVDVVEGQSPHNTRIYQYMKEGEAQKLFTQMMLTVKSASVTPSIAVDGKPVSLEHLLTTPPDMDSAALAQRIYLLTELERQMVEANERAISDLESARQSVSLDESANGAMMEVNQLANDIVAKFQPSLGRMFFGWATDGLTKLFQQDVTAAGSVKRLMAQVNQARRNEAVATAIITLLQGTDAQPGLINRVNKVLTELGQTTSQADHTLAKLAGTQNVSPFAASLVTERVIRLVDGLIRRGTQKDEIESALLRDVCSTPLTIDQLALLLGVRANLDDLAERIKTLYEEAQKTMLHWSEPTLTPWLRAILLPLIDASLLLELQKRMETRLSGVQIWVDPIGNGSSIGLCYGTASGIKLISEIMPDVWIDEVLKFMVKNPQEQAARMFVDRPLPNFILDRIGGDNG